MPAIISVKGTELTLSKDYLEPGDHDITVMVRSGLDPSESRIEDELWLVGLGESEEEIRRIPIAIDFDTRWWHEGVAQARREQPTQATPQQPSATRRIDAVNAPYPSQWDRHKNWVLGWLVFLLLMLGLALSVSR